MATAGEVPAAFGDISVATNDSREKRAGGGGYNSLSGLLYRMYATPVHNSLLTLKIDL